MPRPEISKLRTQALRYPGAEEAFPWGERVVKVKGKVFAFLGHDADREGWGLSVKLATSHEAALAFPFASPTGYGLGKAGWVTARFGPKERAPMKLLLQWLEESYRAVAPKKLLAELDGAPSKPAKKKPATKKPVRARGRRST